MSVKLAEGTNVEEFIRETVRSAGRDGLELGALGQEIHQKFDNFNVQDYGFSQFKKYIRSIGGIEVRKSGSQNMVRYRENG